MSYISIVNDLQELVGKEIDFFLEDDMFDFEGSVKKANGRFIVDITSAIQDDFQLIGKSLEIRLENKIMNLKSLDNEQKFDIFINKVFKSMTNPTKEELGAFNDQGVQEFFRKSDETIIAYDDTTGMWLITFFGDDLPSGKIKSYPTLEALYDENEHAMHGKWDAIYNKFESWHP